MMMKTSSTKTKTLGFRDTEFSLLPDVPLNKSEVDYSYMQNYVTNKVKDWKHGFDVLNEIFIRQRELFFKILKNDYVYQSSVTKSVATVLATKINFIF